MITIDPSVLIGYYDSKAGILENSSGSSSTSSSSTTPAAPKAPWSALNATAEPSALATAALNGANVINPNAALTDVQGASQQYKSLFTLYQGLNALEGLTTQMLANSGGLTSNAQAERAFNTGLGQVTDYVNGLSLPNIRLTNGTVSSTASTTLAPATEKTSYTTGTIFSGGLNDPVPAFQGDVQFNINITSYSGKQTTVPIDLSGLASTDRTMPNVVNFINDQLKAAGAVTRFATSSQIPAASTIKVGSQTVTLPAAPTNWSFKVVGDSEETVSFSAPSTASAVYVAQTSGDPLGGTTTTTTNGTTTSTTVGGTLAAKDAVPIQQLIKLQSTNSTTATPPPAASVVPGTSGSSTDEANATTLGPQVNAVHATATGPDGSVYEVADVTGSIDGQTIQGAQDVALLKYDSAGNFESATTLGASGSATGYSIAVSSTGAVAVAGSTTGTLEASSSTLNAGTSQSFVSVFDSSGDLQWSQQASAVSANQANAVAFGSDGSVYVVGQTSGSLPGGTSSGGQDSYLQGYSSTGTKLFTQQFGASGTDAATSVAVDGSTVVVGGVESGDAVVRSFTLNATGAPTAGATRDLGSLQGGSVAGVAISNGQVIVAGTTSNGSLSAGTATSAFSGNQDAFVAQLSENLSPSSSDAVAYYGGAGFTKATALSVVNGQVYIAGSSSGGLPNLASPTNASKGAAGTSEGFVANIDVASGAVQWSQALQGQDGYDAPESIAVDPTGASVLDRLGLPDGTLQYSSSQLLTSATSVRVGDQFQIKTSGGSSAGTVTISADDTPQALAQKIRQASGYQVTVSVLPSHGKEEVQITPNNPQQTFQLIPGPAGKDALAPLGITAGLVQTGPAIVTPPKVIPGVTSTTTASKKIPTDAYGLNLDQSFDLTTTAGIKAAQTAIQAAMAKVQNAYYNLSTATTPQAPAITGTVPAYLTAQIANYQSALERLTGSTSTSSSSSSTSGAISPSSLALQILS